MGFGRVLGGFGEAKILDFRIFFNVFLKLKFERRFESKNLKTPNGRGSQSFWAGPAECAGCWGEKKTGVQKLAGTEFWKNILGKHFRCSEDRRTT